MICYYHIFKKSIQTHGFSMQAKALMIQLLQANLHHQEVKIILVGLYLQIQLFFPIIFLVYF